MTDQSKIPIPNPQFPHRPPLVPQPVPHRPGQLPLSASCSAPAALSAGGHTNPKRQRGSPRSPRHPTFPPRPKPSSTSSWPARRASSTCSTTSRSSTKLEGKPIPPEVIGGQRYAFIRPDAAVLGPRFKFAKHGQCGAELSEMLPHLAKVVDDIAHRQDRPHRSVQPRPGADLLQHGLPASRAGRAWARGCCTASAPRRRTCRRSSSCPPAAASAAARPTGRAAFCRRVYTGVRLRNQGDPILNVTSPRRRRRAAPARHARPRRPAQPPAARSGRRSGDRHAHRRRTKWPSACRPARRS